MWALALYALYGVLAFGVRGLVQYRRTGDAGFRGLSGRVGSPEWFAGVLFALAVVAGVLAPVADVAEWVQPVGGDTPPTPLAVVGAAIAIAGIAATVGAQFAMGNSWRVGVQRDETTELVTDGPFRLVRNPIYTAMLVTTFGLTLMVLNVPAILAFIGLVAGLEFHVRLVEEPYLTEVQGERYRQYAARVGRFIPGIGRAKVV